MKPAQVFFYMRSSYHTRKLVEKLIFNFFYYNNYVSNTKQSGLGFFDEFKLLANLLKAKYGNMLTTPAPKPGSDQDVFNAILRRKYKVVWPIEPSNWEHCSLENGWLEPVKGKCRKTNMNLVSLPHAYFQRKGTTAETIKHAVVCHPYAGRTQAQKLEKFMSLGIDLLNSRFPE